MVSISNTTPKRYSLHSSDMDCLMDFANFEENPYIFPAPGKGTKLSPDFIPNSIPLELDFTFRTRVIMIVPRLRLL